MKTVKVRIAVSVSPSGQWMGIGASDMNDQEMIDNAMDGTEPGSKEYFLVQELALPEVVEVVATTEPASV